MTTSSSDVLVLRRFLVHAGAVARNVIAECYRSASAASIQGILESARQILSRKEAHVALDAVFAREDESYRRGLVEAMESAASGDARETPLSMFRAADQARELVGELAALYRGAVSDSIADALRRMEFCLRLGQTDDHTMLARHVWHRVPELAPCADRRLLQESSEQSAASR